jgi:hypothetical protein
VDVKPLALGLLVACSGKTKGVEDAHKHPGSGSDVGSAHDTATLGPATGDGDVQLRVEWKDVPVAARASSGRTACGTPRAAAVAPTTTWGVPDVFVMIDVPAKPIASGPVASGIGSGSGSDAAGSAAADAATGSAATATAATRASASTVPTDVRVVLDHCALTPRVALAMTTLVLASAADAPAKLALTKTQQLPFGGTATPSAAKSVYLPVAGHSVEAPLEARGIYHVQVANPDGTFDADDAWIVAADSPFTAITEANGQVVLRDIPVGTHTAIAWLPPRAGQDAKIAHAQVTVTDGGLAEVTLDISK